MSPAAAEAIRFYDFEPSTGDFLGEVVAGLRRRPPAIPPKFFYDAEGSRLFDAICETSEYYPTRTEMRILCDNAQAIADRIGGECLLVEPGSGSSEKVRLLLDALQPHAYMPMDISRDHLLAAARRLAAEYPWLEVHAACVDFTAPLELPYQPDGVRTVAFFPGSSLGNFEPADAERFLRNLRRMVGGEGGLLIGVDLKKDHDLLEAAYNDAAGVTAAFNLNLLNRINRELEGDFVLDDFSHRAFYNGMRGRVEMHLISRCEQQVHLGRERFRFASGDSIHTENSYKYDIDQFQALAQRSGFTPEAVWMDPGRLFSVHFLSAA
jgi:dimethylhistidine N-methyltransferase